MSSRKEPDADTLHPVDVLEREHRMIGAVLDAMDRSANELSAGGRVHRDFWVLAADFMDGFTDQYHESKEENLLFRAIHSCGIPREAGPIAAMSHEHVEGRALSERLRSSAERGKSEEVLRAARAMSYLLRQHFAVEEDVLFQMARDLLDGQQVAEILKGFARLEREIAGEEGYQRYAKMARKLCAESHVPFDSRWD